jgi:hypothetical protein
MAKKKVATAKEKKHLELVASLGCLICQQPAICHHIRNRGDGKGNIGFSKRANHYEVIPLCPSHHVGPFSIHNTKRQFEAMYGTEAELLHRTLKEIKNIEEANNFFNYNKGDNNG